MVSKSEPSKTVTLGGVMDYEAVSTLKKKLLASLDDCRDVLLDLGNVTAADTAFAALLVQMSAKARSLGSNLSVKDTSPTLDQLLITLRLKPLFA